MELSYIDILGDGRRHTMNAKVTTEHSASSYGQPVIVIEDGDALDIDSWLLMNYRVEEASEKERELLTRVLILDPEIQTAHMEKPMYKALLKVKTE